MTETVLFVGGIMDGEKTVLRQAASTLKIPVRQGVKLWVVGDNSRLDVEHETYCRVAPHCFLISTESPDNLIPLLIEGYRRKE